MRPSRPVAVYGALYLAVALCAYVAAAEPLGQRAAPYLGLHGVLTLLMIQGWRASRGAGDVAFAAGVGLAARGALVGVPSFTTTDVTRYLWDGAVALAGRDPYALPPLAAELASLRARWPVPTDHLDVATCYPPLALALFALAALTGPAKAWWAWKLMVAAASSLTVACVWRALRGTPRARDVVLVAWSPVLVLEAGVGAHLDAFAALAVVAAVVSVERRRHAAAALFAGVAGAIKLLPGVIVLALLLRQRRPVWFAALAVAPLALSMAAAELLGLTPPGSLPHVAENWSFAAPLWSVLYGLYPLEDATIRLALGAGAAALILALGLRRGAARGVRDALLVQLAASPVMYPWYASSLAAVTALAPSRGALLVAAAMPCSYEVLDVYQRTGRWEPARWPLALNALALALGLALDLRASWRRCREG